jgi:VCBS repeat-containing protein
MSSKGNPRIRSRRAGRFSTVFVFSFSCLLQAVVAQTPPPPERVHLDPVFFDSHERLLAEHFGEVAPGGPADWALIDFGTAWRPGSPTDFSAYDGRRDDYLAVGGDASGSAWLVSPVVRFRAGARLSFYTRALGDAGRLEIRACTTPPCDGFPTGPSSVGDFDVPVASINPDARPGTDPVGADGYPGRWTRYTFGAARGVPQRGYGRFAFRYVIPDAGGDGIVGLDRVRVDALPADPAGNDAPIAFDLALRTPAARATDPLPPARLGSDAEGNAGLSVVQVDGRAVSPGTTLTLSSGARTGLDADGALVYDPTASSALAALTAGDAARDVVRFTLADDDGRRAQGRIAVTVDGVNDPPAPLDPGVDTDEDTPVTIAPTALAEDPDAGDTLAVTAIDGESVTAGDEVTLAAGDRVRLDTDHGLIVTPARDALAAGASTSFGFAVSVADRAGLATDSSVTVNVTGRNDAPVADNVERETDEDTPITIALADLARDVDDGDTLRATAVAGRSAAAGDSVTLPAGDHVAIGSDAITITPARDALAAGESARLEFDVTLADDADAARDASVGIDITGRNDAPVAGITDVALAYPGAGLAFTSQPVPETIESVAGIPDAAEPDGHVTAPTSEVRDRDEFFGLTFTGFLDANVAGDYTFHLHSTDGSVLRIGGDVVVDNDGRHAARTASGTVSLDAGLHAFELRHFHTTGTPALSLELQAPGRERAPVGSVRFLRARTTATVDLLAAASDVDAGETGQLRVAGIDGRPVAPGDLLTLPGGLRLTVHADGTATVDGNGALWPAVDAASRAFGRVDRDRGYRVFAPTTTVEPVSPLTLERTGDDPATWRLALEPGAETGSEDRFVLFGRGPGGSLSTISEWETEALPVSAGAAALADALVSVDPSLAADEITVTGSLDTGFELVVEQQDWVLESVEYDAGGFALSVSPVAGAASAWDVQPSGPADAPADPGWTYSLTPGAFLPLAAPRPAALRYDADAATIEAAVEALPGIDDATVTGSLPAGGYRVEIVSPQPYDGPAVRLADNPLRDRLTDRYDADGRRDIHGGFHRSPDLALDPLPIRVSVADPSGATASSPLLIRPAQSWQSLTPAGPVFGPFRLTNDAPDVDGLGDPDDALGVDARCSIPRLTRVAIDSGFGRAVRLGLRAAPFVYGNRRDIAFGGYWRIQRTVGVDAASTRVVEERLFDNRRFADFALVWADRYRVDTTGSNAIESCYAPDMSLVAVGSTYSTSRFELSNGNEDPVQYRLSWSAGASEGTIAPGATEAVDVPYDERLRLLLNGLSVASVAADVDRLVDSFRDNLDVSGVCRTTDRARFEVRNSNDEFVALTIAPELTEIPVRAGETKTFEVAYEPRISVLVKEASYGIVAASAETCSIQFDLAVEQGCVLDGGATRRALIPVVNNEDRALEVKVQSLENQSVQTDFRFIDAIQKVVVELFLESVEPGTEARLLIRAPDGSGDIIEGPTFTLPTRSCG